MAVRLTDRQKELDSWSETKLQRNFIDVVEDLGGIANFVRPCRQGNRMLTASSHAMPDLTLWFPRRTTFARVPGVDHRGTILVEIKATRGELKPSQVTNFPLLRASGEPVYVWWARWFDRIMVPAATYWAGHDWPGTAADFATLIEMGRTRGDYIDVRYPL